MTHSNRQDQRPAFQFYPGDWKRDDNLRLCSLAARGLWLEMLCTMFFSEKRGSLCVAGKQITSKELAKLVAEPEANVKQMLSELERAGVFSRDDDGTIYSRRMRREASISQARAEAGRKGGSKQNPSKIETKPKQTAEDEVEEEHEGVTSLPAEPRIKLSEWTITFCNWWSMTKGARTGIRFREFVNPFFTDARRLKFAVWKASEYRATLKPWDLRDKLVDDWRRYWSNREAGAKEYRAWAAENQELAERLSKQMTDPVASATGDRTR
jgi:hypothetical protein